MENVLDIQRDHVDLLTLAMARLEEDGELIFSNNYRRFTLDQSILDTFEVENITKASLDLDFERNSKIHQCWIIKHKSQEEQAGLDNIDLFSETL
jgi:23S rRNA (guanine2445-N2)-methyltransferase / 23S rRNA (guanine2069-N7)-methyltransferase